MLASDADAAMARMQAAGGLCHADTVAAAESRDECGSLNALAETLDRENVNPDCLYITCSGPSKRPAAILRA